MAIARVGRYDKHFKAKMPSIEAGGWGGGGDGYSLELYIAIIIAVNVFD